MSKNGNSGDATSSSVLLRFLSPTRRLPFVSRDNHLAKSKEQLEPLFHSWILPRNTLQHLAPGLSAIDDANDRSRQMQQAQWHHHPKASTRLAHGSDADDWCRRILESIIYNLRSVGGVSAVLGPTSRDGRASRALKPRICTPDPLLPEKALLQKCERRKETSSLIESTANKGSSACKQAHSIRSIQLQPHPNKSD